MTHVSGVFGTPYSVPQLFFFLAFPHHHHTMKFYYYFLLLLAIQMAYTNSPVFKIEDNTGELVFLWGCQLLSRTAMPMKKPNFFMLHKNQKGTCTCHAQHWPTKYKI